MRPAVRLSIAVPIALAALVASPLPAVAAPEGAPVAASAGAASEAAVLGSIAGRVTRSRDGEPISGYVFVHDAEAEGGAEPLTWARIGDDGRYVVPGLAPGDYFAWVRTSIYVDEVYDDVPCPESCVPGAGTPISVPLAADASVDFVVDEKGLIAGRITAADSGEPLAARVSAQDRQGRVARWAETDPATGGFEIRGLVPGSYYVVAHATGSDDYESQLYDGFGCDPDCIRSVAEPIATALGSVIEGIDLALLRCSLRSHQDAGGAYSYDSVVEACRSIRSDATILWGATLTLRAGRSVVLEDGFTIEAGGRLQVVVDPSVGRE